MDDRLTIILLLNLGAKLGTLAFASTFQVDLGVDFSDPVDTVSVSMIYSF